MSQQPQVEAADTQPHFSTPSSIALLARAKGHQEQRAKDYDQPGGERSMGKTVAAFNIFTDRDLSESEGWLFMQILKDVRDRSVPAGHQDSIEDCVSYAALKGEARLREGALLNTLNVMAAGATIAKHPPTRDVLDALEKVYALKGRDVRDTITVTIGLCDSALEIDPARRKAVIDACKAVLSRGRNVVL